MNLFRQLLCLFLELMMSLFVFGLYVQIVVFIYSHNLTLCLVQTSHRIFGPNLIFTYVEALLSVPEVIQKVINCH
jgi:hypothetical protein